MRLQWVKQQVEENLGFEPYPGTLDVRIKEESVKQKKALLECGIRILPAEGFHRGRLYRAVFKTDSKCGVVVPEVAGYPGDVVEVIAADNLREKFHLSDGDMVEVEVKF